MDLIKKLQRSVFQKRLAQVLILTVSASVSLAIIGGALFGLSVLTQLFISYLLLILLLALVYLSGGLTPPPEDEIIRWLDRKFPFMEDSASILVKEPENILEQWQRNKIEQLVQKQEEQIQIRGRGFARTGSLCFLMLAASISFHFLYHPDFGSVTVSSSIEDVPTEELPSISERNIPIVNRVDVLVSPPAYTGISERAEDVASITAEEFSEVTWNVKSDHAKSAELLFNDGTVVPLEKGDGLYSGSIGVRNSSMYRLAITGADTTIFSEYYSLSVITDTPPGFRFSSPTQFRNRITETVRSLPVRVEISDDYGVTSAEIRATLARGAGESVRFRERTLPFDKTEGLGTASVQAGVTLDADNLEMEPGDELYFYLYATDNHPDTQSGRSPTYMFVYEDTTRRQGFAAGGIVVDLMPEDFRSQRQIIIDTENLIEEKERISEERFQQRSRRIGQDQAMLRLQFGHYLGLEHESNESGGYSAGAVSDDHDHDSEDHQDLNSDPSHTHDDLDEDGLQQELSRSAAVIPHDFYHNHGSAEMNTLFADSPRMLLQQSLQAMWEAARYLQTDRPEEALPYEYKALELLQAAQQAERRYVRRAGYEGIPIPVDEKRLTGSYDNFANPQANSRSVPDGDPLAIAEIILRDQVRHTASGLETAAEEIRWADIPESEKLYLLNRIIDLASDGNQQEVRYAILARISKLKNEFIRDPAPRRIPQTSHNHSNR